MKKIKCFGLLMICGLLFGNAVQAQKNKLITENSAGVIKLGMSVTKVRQVASPLKVSKGINVFEGDMRSRITNGKKLVMTIIEYYKKITLIEIWDSSYHTAEGIRVGMQLKDLEKIYGSLKQISIDEHEGFEYAVFSEQPKGIIFRVAVAGKGKYAGIYPKDPNDPNTLESFTTTKFNSGIYLKTIRLQTTE